MTEFYGFPDYLAVPGIFFPLIARKFRFHRLREWPRKQLTWPWNFDPSEAEWAVKNKFPIIFPCYGK